MRILYLTSERAEALSQQIEVAYRACNPDATIVPKTIKTTDFGGNCVILNRLIEGLNLNESDLKKKNVIRDTGETTIIGSPDYSNGTSTIPVEEIDMTALNKIASARRR